MLQLITQYTQYLLTKPMKIVYLVLLNAFTQVLGIFTFSDEMYQNNSTWVVVGLAILTTVINIAANYHPFREWQDANR